MVFNVKRVGYEFLDRKSSGYVLRHKFVCEETLTHLFSVGKGVSAGVHQYRRLHCVPFRSD